LITVFILDCLLRAGAIVYDGLGGKKEFVKNKLINSSLNNCNKHKEKKEKLHNSPWWDKE